MKTSLIPIYCLYVLVLCTMYYRVHALQLPAPSNQSLISALRAYINCPYPHYNVHISEKRLSTTSYFPALDFVLNWLIPAIEQRTDVPEDIFEYTAHGLLFRIAKSRQRLTQKMVLNATNCLSDWVEQYTSRESVSSTTILVFQKGTSYAPLATGIFTKAGVEDH